jgi:5-methylcytosine-specific restriction endonuclease McrA
MDTTNLPKTREEAKKTGSKYYFTGLPCKHGHIAARKTKGACIECLKVEWTKGNETRADYFREYNQSDAGKQAKQKYYAQNKDAVVARANEWVANNRDKHNKKCNAWAKRNKASVNARTARRYASKTQATPSFVTHNPDLLWMIQEAYDLAQLRTKMFDTPWEVDHIIPLRGKKASGLHTPWNLRVIPMSENRRKSNIMAGEFA